MVSLIATLIAALLIIVLLKVTREKETKRSAAALIAFAWLWFASSRNPSLWLQPHPVFTTNAGSAYSEGNTFDRNILTGILLVGVVVLATRSQRSAAFLTANIPMLLFFLYCGLSALWSDHPDISIRRWFRSMGDLLMVMVILTDLDWVAAFRWLYTRLALFLIPLSILFFRYYPQLGRNYSIHDGHVSVTGVTDDKNALGMICMLFALTVTWSLIEAFRNKEPKRKSLLIGYGVVLAMAIYIIVIANSATATACLILGGAVLFLTSKPKIYKRPALTHLIVLGMLGISAFALFASATLVGLLGRNSTLTGRTDLWALCLSLVENPLLGAGYESFWLGSRLAKMWTYMQGVNQAHNGYLEIYLNLGLIGVALLVGLLIAGYRNIISAVRRGEPAASLRLAFFVAVCVYNCTEAGFKMVHPMWIALLMVAAARPALNFLPERLPGYTERAGESSKTRGLINAPASASKLEFLARKGR